MYAAAAPGASGACSVAFHSTSNIRVAGGEGDEESHRCSGLNVPDANGIARDLSSI